MLNVARMLNNFLQHCSLYLNFLRNYFAGPIKLFLNLYLAKLLNILTKSFFLLNIIKCYKEAK